MLSAVRGGACALRLLSATTQFDIHLHISDGDDLTSRDTNTHQFVLQLQADRNDTDGAQVGEDSRQFA